MNDKKADIVAAMKWADKYALKLCLEKLDQPFWVGKGDDSVFFDAKEIRKVPAFVGRSVAQTKKLIDQKIANGQEIKESEIPRFEAVLDDKGEPILVALDFDVDVVIGSAIPRSKNDMFYIIMSLIQLTVIDPVTGMVVPFLETKLARDLLEDALGIKMTSGKEDEKRQDASILSGINQPTGINPIGEQGAPPPQQGAVQPPAQSMMPTANATGTPGMDMRGISG